MQHIIEKIRTELQTEGRAIATANTFNQFFNVAADSLTEANLKSSLLKLSTAKGEDEHPAITARRKTCAEIAALIDVNPSETTATRAWSLWANHCELSAITAQEEEKPRFLAMLETAKREMSELRF